MSTTQSIQSIGFAACCCQMAVDRFARLAQHLNIEPAVQINNVPHYATEDVEAILKYARENKSQ